MDKTEGLLWEGADIVRADGWPGDFAARDGNKEGVVASLAKKAVWRSGRRPFREISLSASRQWSKFNFLFLLEDGLPLGFNFALLSNPALHARCLIRSCKIMPLTVMTL